MVFLDLLKNVGVLGQNLDREADLLKQKITGAIDPIAYEIAKGAQQFQQEYGVYDFNPETGEYILNPQKQQVVLEKLLPLVMAFSGGMKDVSKLPFKVGRIDPKTYDINRGVTSENIGVRPEPIPSKLRPLESSTRGVSYGR